MDTISFGGSVLELLLWVAYASMHRLDLLQSSLFRIIVCTLLAASRYCSMTEAASNTFITPNESIVVTVIQW